MYLFFSEPMLLSRKKHMMSLYFMFCCFSSTSNLSSLWVQCLPGLLIFNLDACVCMACFVLLGKSIFSTDSLTFLYVLNKRCSSAWLQYIEPFGLKR